MIVDTGADHCIFDDKLATPLGINPAMHGDIVGTVGIGLESEPSAIIHNIQMKFPQLGYGFTESVMFKPLQEDINGLLGNGGFLNHFSQVSFFPRDRFELIPLDSSEITIR